MITSNSLIVGRVAIATGTVGLLALVLLVLFFTFAGPFGTLNDIFNGLTGILSAVLAGALYRKFHIHPIFFILALAGTLLVVTGSILVIFEITGWYLAGLYTAAGYALIGLWLLALNSLVRQTQAWPPGVVTFGLIAGLVMALGLLTLPGIARGIDAWELGPWYVNYLGNLGSIGYFLLYPIWCILVGRSLLRA